MSAIIGKKQTENLVNLALSESKADQIEVVIFNYLDRPALKKIVGLELEKVKERLEKIKQIKVDFSPGLEEALAQKGFDPNLGARPLKRVVQKLILDPLSLKLITAEIKQGDRISCDFSQDQVVFHTPQALKPAASRS